ncbi:MAG TPA: hypothetical protein VF274_06475 [Alphaproteobacteria bacterium]
MSTKTGPVSKHAETITLPLPVEAAVEACQEALRAGNWKITNTDGRNFLVKESFGLVSTLLSYPTRAAVLVRDQSDNETRIELHGSIFGFGPLQSRRVRAAIARLRADIERAAAAVTADA